MLRDKNELRIPGPVPVPPTVLLETARPMINHRGKDFKELMPKILRRLQPLFGTCQQVLPITGSGTAAMEMAIANVVSKDDAILCLVGGAFGQRWAAMGKAYGANVHELAFPWGEGIDPEIVSDYLTKNPQVKVVFATHNESSTAVLNDIEGIGRVTSEFGALLVVDAVSSLGGVPFEMDKWNVDVVCTASQKCLMTPPGLGFVAFSNRARKISETVTSPRFYFRLSAYEQMLEKGETPFTPNIANFFGLAKALDMIEEEGLANVFARHILMRDMVRAGIKALGLPLLVSDKWASPTTTGVKPDGLDVDSFRSRLRSKYGVELAGGQGKFAGQIFRIGHMGYATPLDMLTCLAALETALKKPGQAVKAAEEVWANKLD